MRLHKLLKKSRSRNISTTMWFKGASSKFEQNSRKFLGFDLTNSLFCSTYCFHLSDLPVCLNMTIERMSRFQFLFQSHLADQVIVARSVTWEILSNMSTRASISSSLWMMSNQGTRWPFIWWLQLIRRKPRGSRISPSAWIQFISMGFFITPCPTHPRRPFLNVSKAIRIYSKTMWTFDSARPSTLARCFDFSFVPPWLQTKDPSEFESHF